MVYSDLEYPLLSHRLYNPEGQTHLHWHYEGVVEAIVAELELQGPTQAETRWTQV